ncbi:hypothetical protein KBD71_00195 [Candidatus Woesebacteria bacterium]|nr:hypothetical protein [Candidatus Woesebacteria bacterium]
MKNRTHPFSIENTIIAVGLVLVVLAYVLSAFSLFQVEVLRGIGLAIGVYFFIQLVLHHHKILHTTALRIFAVFALIAFIQGSFSVPTTTDAHNYHIPRAIYWLQNHSVFQSVIHTSHDFMGPLPSILLSLMYSLTNSDLLLFVPQWLAYVAIFFLIGRLAKLLEYSSRQIQSAQLISLSIPIATLQASSVQSDLLVAVWVLVSVIFAVRYLKEQSKIHLLLCTLSVFLGFLTKATMVIYAVIPIGLLSWQFLSHREDRVNMLKVGMIGCFIGTLLCLPHLLQNNVLFHSYLGTSYTVDGKSIPFTVNSLSIAGSIENVYRNIFMHIPFLSFSPILDSLVDGLKPVGISIDLSETSWFNSEFFHASLPIPQEDIAPAPLHMLIIGVALVTVIRRNKKILNNQTLLFASSICAFIVFCIVLRWQPYHIRQQMSIIFLLIVSGIGVINLSNRALNVLCTLSVAIGLVVIVSNVSRPIISYQPLLSKVAVVIPEGFSPPESVLRGRNVANYFLSRPYWQPAYIEMTSYLHEKNINKVGFTGREGYVYPFIKVASKQNIVVVPAADPTSKVKVVAGLIEDQQLEKAQYCSQTADANKVICVYFNP